MEQHSLSITIGGKELLFQTGKIARQANGAVLVTCGETVTFSTACCSKEADPTIDFLPLKVDYQEKFSAAGKTLNGFIKREGRPTEREILLSRMIDRPLRPLFEEGYYNEVQVLSYVWSYDGINSPDPLAICASAAALAISDIPLKKPVGAVRVGLIDHRFIINPTVEEQNQSKLDLLIAGTEDAVLMIEGYCDFLTETQVLEAISVGHQAIITICKGINGWVKKIGKPKNYGQLRPLSQEILNEVEALTKDKLISCLQIHQKQEREAVFSTIKQAVQDAFFPEGETAPRFTKVDIDSAFKAVSAKYMRLMILQDKIRSDGRSTTDIRPIDIQQSLLPRTHGSSLFTRGETQTVAVCTLGGETMGQRFEDLNGEGTRRFYMQYTFPPFSVGEVGRIGGAGRREIGHGKLAERALSAALPSKEAFPYTIRLESNITESNGSSSMATVCGGSLSMMDAGVPIKRPVAGIAMGLILEKEKYAILSDILGIEDALGDMDFKIAGDHEGITAFQMDIKIEGINLEIMKAALAQAKEGRIHILNKMLEVCPKYKDSLSLYAPRIETVQIKPSKIGIIIGPGGKQIRLISETTGVLIDINDSGLISLSSPSLEGIEKAKAMIHSLTAEVEIGKTYQGKVVSIVPFGLFVEVLPGKEGLCHISEFDLTPVQNLGDHVKQGDEIVVKVIDINERGQLKLSRKATLRK